MERLRSALIGLREAAASTCPDWAGTWPEWDRCPEPHPDPFTAQEVRDAFRPILDALPACWAALGDA